MPHACKRQTRQFGRDEEGDFCMSCGHRYPHRLAGTPAWDYTKLEGVYPVHSDSVSPVDFSPGGTLPPIKAGGELPQGHRQRTGPKPVPYAAPPAEPDSVPLGGIELDIYPTAPTRQHGKRVGGGKPAPSDSVWDT